jgi:hypothetical protein
VASGGFGNVYECAHRVQNGKVAVKIFKHGPNKIESARREHLMLWRLNKEDPNSVYSLTSHAKN